VSFKSDVHRGGTHRDFNKHPIHAQSQADPKNTLESMKAIVQTANVEEEAISLKELIPFWFAVSSPLVGILLGLLGAWCVTWLSA
jgi:hypothetical protein